LRLKAFDRRERRETAAEFAEKSVSSTQA